MLWGMSTSAETKPHVMLTNSGRISEEKSLHNISLDCFFGAIVGASLEIRQQSHPPLSIESCCEVICALNLSWILPFPWSAVYCSKSLNGSLVPS